MEIDELARRIGTAGTDVTSCATRLARADPGTRAFLADAPGLLGELGRELRAGWSAALAAREREAAAHGARLGDLAEALRRAGEGYREVDASAAQRLGDGA